MVQNGAKWDGIWAWNQRRATRVNLLHSPLAGHVTVRATTQPEDRPIDTRIVHSISLEGRHFVTTQSFLPGVQIAHFHLRNHAGVITLADRISSSQAAISHYEAGTRAVPLEILIEIARELRKPLSYFLGVHDEIMVVKGTTLYEIAKGIEEHPEDLELLKQLWGYVRWQRGR